MKQFLILFGSMLVSIASVFSNEFQFISFFDPSNPSLSDNPASIAKMSGFYIDTNMPISYSSTNVIRESKYYKDIYSGNNEVQFKNENTKIINGKLGLNNYGITYNNHTSKFKDDLKNTNHFMKINEENFEKIKTGIVLGKNFGPLLVGVHQQIISMTSTIKTESVPELKYSVNYMQPTYGIMSSISFFS